MPICSSITLTYQLKSLILPFSTDQKSAPGTSSLALFPLITPAGESNVRVKVPRPDSSIRNDIPYVVNSMEYPVNVCSMLAQQIHQPGQFLTAEGLNAGTDHAVAAKQLDESLHVHDVALALLGKEGTKDFPSRPRLLPRIPKSKFRIHAQRAFVAASMSSAAGPGDASRVHSALDRLYRRKFRTWERRYRSIDSW